MCALELLGSSFSQLARFSGTYTLEDRTVPNVSAFELRASEKDSEM